MRFNILGDFDWEARVDQVLDSLSNSGYRSYFEQRDYGPGLAGITVVLMCQAPELNLRRRVQLSKKEKKLYMDIMLDLAEMKRVDRSRRKTLVTERLIREVPEVLSKYKISDFDSARFIEDFRLKFSET